MCRENIPITNKIFGVIVSGNLVIAGAVAVAVAAGGGAAAAEEEHDRVRHSNSDKKRGNLQIGNQF
jgi:hypothetical protein